MSSKRGTRRGRSPARKASDDIESTLSGRIALEIADEIVGGARAPGSHLNEQMLADQFGVSRTPIREAIRQLVAMELIEILPRRGAFVTRIPVKRLFQMFEFMSEMEAISARLAARRMSASEKKELERLHTSCKNAAGTEESLRNFYDFHMLIFAGSKNEPLQAAASQLYGRLMSYRKRQVQQIGRAAVSFTEHEEVLKAIMDGDGDAAEAAMRSHTGSILGSMMDMISSLEDD